ncbi:MAG: hypothetical protein V2J20_01250 [Wenzhouxiangella sp.]|nr:hypothetical protein [Wenzhouxiangella sp.]
MRVNAPAFQSALAVVAMTLAASLWANPTGFSINSRGNDIPPGSINNLWQVNLQSGEETNVGPLVNQFLDVEALALSPSGDLYGADDDTNSLVRVRTTDGFAFPITGTSVGNMGVTGTFDFGMSFDCDGTLFVVSAIEQSLFQASLSSGQLRRVGEPGALAAPISDIAVRGDDVFGIGVGLDANGSTLAPNLYRIDLENASARLVGSLGPEALPYNNAGLSFGDDGSLWAMTDRSGVDNQFLPSQILRIDPLSGRAEAVAETLIGMESLAIAPPVMCQMRGASDAGAHAIPIMSPPGAALLVLTMLGLAGLRLRRQQS